jgi:hypothetical protein
MKRMLQALISSPPEKRVRREEEKQSVRKTPKASLADVHAHLDAIERLQARLLAIDKDCLREQLEVQRKHDNSKMPLLGQRKEEISKIPGFWLTAIGNHPFVSKEAWKHDKEILSYLDSVELDDNTDENGSYTLTFRFSDANPFFSNWELIRSVTILEDQSDIVTSTPVMWAPNRKPQPVHPKSFFAWFSSNGGLAIDEDFGEVLRRDLWQNPYPYYLNIAPNAPRPLERDQESVTESNHS